MACGNKRSRVNEYRPVQDGRESVPAAPGTSPSPDQPVNASSVLLRYLQRGALSLRGPSTGRIYYVDDGSAVVAVHPDDVPALLRTGLFRRDGRT